MLLLSLTGCIPLLTDAWYGFPTQPWWIMLGATLGLATGLLLIGRKADPLGMGIREGLAITTLIWIVASLCASIGITLAAPGTHWVAGWFEAMSGFTTTGSTIFGDHIIIDDLSPGVKMWRAVMQWMGGIGIVVISLALLPLLVGGSGFQVYRAEVPGLDTDRLAPRIRDTAKILFRFYIILTFGMGLLLLLCGLSPFDAICHAMTTVATGGFANYGNSVEGLQSVAAEWVIILGMVVAGVNFGLLVQAVLGKPMRLWSAETKLYLGLIVGCSTAIALNLGFTEPAYDGKTHDLIRDSLFQVSSLITSSGFGSGYDTVSASYGGWPLLSQCLLVFLMLGGGCAGSTAGGIKLIRYLVAVKALRRELLRYIEPARIVPIRLDGHKVNDQMVLQVMGFLLFILFAGRLD